MDKLKEVGDIINNIQALITIFGAVVIVFFILNNYLKSTFFKKLYRVAYGSEYRKN